MDVATRVRNGAEWFWHALIMHGVDAVFLNPGTDTPPLQEAYAQLRHDGIGLPRLVTCPHEVVAVSAAQGAFLTSGRPQVALVHVDVGTANAAGSLNNAAASNIPVLLCAGAAPATIESSIPGARSKFINWHQDVRDQCHAVRNYAKQAQIVGHPAAIGRSIDRAFQIAASDPQGPVYLAFPREGMLAKVEEMRMLGPAKSPPARAGSLSHGDAESLARRIAEARFPVLSTAYLGRTPAGRAALSALAERLAVPVVEYRGRFNLPLAHPMHLGFNGEAHLQHADLLLVVDHDVPFVPADMPLADDAHVVVIGIDPIRERWGTWGFPVDEVHAVDPVGALEAIVEAADRPRDEARYDRIRLLHEKMLGGRKLAADGPHLAPGEVGRLLTELAPDAMVFEEAVTSANPFAYGFEPSENGAYIRNGGSYLGWSLGASLGARLGDPSRRVITVVGDGSFMFGAPTPALWTARQQGLPLLVVILNNESYNAVALASDQMFPDGAQVHFGHVGTSLSGAPAFEVIAQACGAWGARVDHREQLRPALEEALRKVDAGQSAVLNVMTVASTRAL